MVAGWTVCGDFMYFQALDNSQTPVLALAYKFSDHEGETWTGRFNEFKFGGVQAQSTAIRKASAVLQAACRGLAFTQPVTLVSAIGSGDTSLDPRCALSRLGTSLAGQLQWQWQPTVLSKRVHASLKTLASMNKRDAEVAGAYRASSPPKVGTVLILDDFATRGSTISNAAKALSAAGCTATIYGLVLGKTERSHFWLERGTPIDNSHVPSKLDKIWSTA